jgi:sucrose phosphorylase
MKVMCMQLAAETKILEHLKYVYGEAQAEAIQKHILAAMARFKQAAARIPDSDDNFPLSEKDVILITYGDTIKHAGQSPLRTLTHFLDENLEDKISIVHILPFFPYSSDDGFSVIDYRSVNPELGSWEDMRRLAQKYKLMFDAVINHISRESDWFKRFVDGDEHYQDYFLTPDATWDLSQVVRPRTSKLLTEVETAKGLQKVWTTFSADQIDLNYANPDVFVEIVDLLLFYIRQGASVIRLDAIAYMWKESGTPCIHLPQTHHLIKIMRLVVDLVAPHVILITETNVPHEENISYFGEIDADTGVTDEAHMVYQFPLAPLVLHTLMIGNTRNLTDWVEGLESPGIFMNFIASHDGIGMLPAMGLIDEQDVAAIIAQVKLHGGKVSYKSNTDGSETVYELNTTLYDALNDPQRPNPQVDIPRFIASQVIMISLAGVPGIYFHSLLGSHNAHDYYHQTGRARSINRQGFTLKALEEVLSDPETTHAQVFERYKRLLAIRKGEAAFHPRGAQQVLRVSDKVFALERHSPDGKSKVLVLVNVTEKTCEARVALQQTGLSGSNRFVDLIGGGEFIEQEGMLSVNLGPYQALWLKAND